MATFGNYFVGQLERDKNYRHQSAISFDKDKKNKTILWDLLHFEKTYL